jgi:hypothetical protein
MPKQLSRLTAVFCLCAFSGSLWGQVNGGRAVFAFAEMPVSARLTALGGYLVSVRDDDHTLAYANPALLNEKAHHALSFNHNFHLGGTGSGYFGYAHHAEKLATTFHGGVQYLNYGDILRTDEFNQQFGTFSPGDLAVVVGASRRYLDRLQYGLNLRYLQSVLEAYASTGLTADAGLFYENPEERFGIGVALQNVGWQISRFDPDGEPERMPLNLVIGFSKRLQFLPFRYSITAHSLHRWDVRYDDPALRQTNLFPGQEPDPDNRLAQGVDNLFRHLTFSGELLLGKNENFRLRFAYDHRMRREMLVPGYSGMAGFSGGVGARVYRFRIDYGFGGYHLAGATHHLSIGTRLTEFFPGL